MADLMIGTVVQADNGTVLVNVDGTNIAAGFMTGYIPVPGDSVRLLRGAGTAIVLGGVLPSAAPALGRVVSSAGGTARVEVDGGRTIDARYTGSAPTNLSVVRLDWTSTTPWVAGVVQAAPPPKQDEGEKPKPPPPRPPAQTGMLTVPASVSGSFRPPPGYARFESGDVRQSRYGSGQAYMGTWLYPQAQLQSLRGRAITGVRVRVGARLRIGNFNNPMEAHILRRADDNPNANPNVDLRFRRVYGVAGNAGPHWVDLPVGLGEALRDGGGLVLAGPTYGGFVGRISDPESGLLQISWRRE